MNSLVDKAISILWKTGRIIVASIFVIMAIVLNLSLSVKLVSASSDILNIQFGNVSIWVLAFLVSTVLTAFFIVCLVLFIYLGFRIDRINKEFANNVYLKQMANYNRDAPETERKFRLLGIQLFRQLNKLLSVGLLALVLITWFLELLSLVFLTIYILLYILAILFMVMPESFIIHESNSE